MDSMDVRTDSVEKESPMNPMDTAETTDQSQPGLPATQPIDAPIEPAGKKLKLIWVVLAVLGLALLGGAAYMGAQLLNQRPEKAGGPGEIVMNSKGGSMSRKAVSFDVKPASEIPQTKADVTGVLEEIKDRSLFVTTGSGGMMAAMSADGTVKLQAENEGPQMEVVVTGDTKIYRDVTFDEDMPEEGGSVQQIVEPLEFSELETNAFATVWGQKRGDRLIAEVILYNKPGGLNKGK